MTALTRSERGLLKADAAFMVNNMNVFITHAVLWGIYVVVFAFTVHCMIVASIKQRARLLMLFAIILLFATSTTLFSIDVFNVFWQTDNIMLASGVQIFSTRTRQAYGTWLLTSYAFQLVFYVAFLVGDAIVIWRAWVFWKGSVAVYFPIFVWIASLGALITERILYFTTGIYESSLDRPAAISGVAGLGIASYALSGATNAICTAMIAYKAWKHRKFMRESLRHSKPSVVERIFALLVESGMIYLCFWVISVYTNFTLPVEEPARSFVGVWSTIGNHFVGMYPTVIVALVELQRSAHDHLTAPDSLSFPTTNPDDLHSPCRNDSDVRMEDEIIDDTPDTSRERIDEREDIDPSSSADEPDIAEVRRDVA